MSGTPHLLRLVLTQRAERDLLHLAEEIRQRVKADILRLAQGSLSPRQVKKLHGFFPAIWQLTSGEFRVFYRRIDEQLLLLRVVHKPDQLKALRALR